MAVTEKEFRQAEARASQLRASSAYAVRARYDSGRGRIRVWLASGLEIAIPPRDAQGLEHATTSDLERIEITASGLGLHFPRLDADLYIPGWLSGQFGSRAWMEERRLRGAVTKDANLQDRKRRSVRRSTRAAAE